MQAKDVMTKDVITAREDTPVEQIANLMIEHRISGVPIVNGNDFLVGIVTEHDLLYKKKQPISISWIYNYGFYSTAKLEEERHKMEAKSASEIMTRAVFYISEQTPLSEVVRLMIDKGIKRTPVVRGRQLVGILSKADVLKILVEEIKIKEIINASQRHHDHGSSDSKEGYVY